MGLHLTNLMVFSSVLPLSDYSSWLNFKEMFWKHLSWELFLSVEHGFLTVWSNHTPLPVVQKIGILGFKMNIWLDKVGMKEWHGVLPMLKQYTGSKAQSVWFASQRLYSLVITSSAWRDWNLTVKKDTETFVHVLRVLRPRWRLLT